MREILGVKIVATSFTSLIGGELHGIGSEGIESRSC
jgi:hypothetical protein